MTLVSTLGGYTQKLITNTFNTPKKHGYMGEEAGRPEILRIAPSPLVQKKKEKKKSSSV